MTMLISTIAWCTPCVERARRAHSSTFDVVSHLIWLKSWVFSQPWRTPLWLVSPFLLLLVPSCLFPSTSSTPSCTLSWTTRSSWKACATPPTRRVRTPTTSPLPSQILSRIATSLGGATRSLASWSSRRNRRDCASVGMMPIFEFESHFEGEGFEPTREYFRGAQNLQLKNTVNTTIHTKSIKINYLLWYQALDVYKIEKDCWHAGSQKLKTERWHIKGQRQSLESEIARPKSDAQKLKKVLDVIRLTDDSNSHGNIEFIEPVKDLTEDMTQLRKQVIEERKEAQAAHVSAHVGKRKKINSLELKIVSEREHWDKDAKHT